MKDRLVFAKGYGYRDYGKKIPFTPTTTMPIASNTKLFTSIAAGLLVDEGKLDWNKPIRKYVPGIEFYNDDLNRTVTIRDMLAHRTGITRHDAIWYKSDFGQKELFQRIKYLEPTEPLRQTFIYNNMMYVGAGYATELLSGKPWEAFVRERLRSPLGMRSTVFSIAEMRKQPDQRLLPEPHSVAAAPLQNQGIPGRHLRVCRCQRTRNSLEAVCPGRRIPFVRKGS